MAIGKVPEEFIIERKNLYKKLPKHLKVKRYVGLPEQYRIYADASQTIHGAAFYVLLERNGIYWVRNQK